MDVPRLLEQHRDGVVGEHGHADRLPPLFAEVVECLHRCRFASRRGGAVCGQRDDEVLPGCQRSILPVPTPRHESETMTTHVDRVNYFSPFSSTTRMPLSQAVTYLERERQRCLRLKELEMASDAQRAAGPPRIELE